MFNLLCTKADNNPNGSGRHKYHVRCQLDEFANIGLIPEFEKLIAMMDTKDFIAPSSLKITKNYFELGNGCYGTVSALNVLSGELSDEVLSDFLSLDNIVGLV